MKIRSINLILKLLAILLWITIFLIIVVSIMQHNFWRLTPIFAYNHPQGLLGWSICLAIVLSVLTVLTKKK